MPSIDFKFISDILESENDKYPIFVETGTWHGETILKMEPYFEKLFTIEIKPELYNEVKSKYSGSKINFVCGDSSYEIKNVCDKIDNNTIFFLDGHWSCGDTGKGEKDIPLIEEVESIFKNLKQKCIIIIDDVRLFGKGPRFNNEVCNWEEISVEKIKNILNDRISEWYYKPSELHSKDRLIIHLKDI